MMDTPAPLPTGGCNFHDLSQGVNALSCGCQRFWLRRKRKKGSSSSKRKPQPPSKGKEVSRISEESAAAAAQQPNDDRSSDEDEDDEECRCGHHACYHSPGSPIPPRTQRRYSLQISDTETSLRLDRSATNLAASGFSITSGTTTERDYSEQSPSVVAARNLKGHHAHYQPSHLSSHSSATKSSSQATTNRGGEKYGDMIQAVVHSTLESFFSSNSALLGPRQQTSTSNSAISQSTVVPAAPSADIAGLDSKLNQILKELGQLKETDRLQSERLETVETFGSVLEEVRDKIELAEDRANEIEEKVFSFENRLDDRLGPIESLLRSRSEKRKGEDDGHRARKRRKGARERDFIDTGSPQETKTLTMTSFTTTTSTSTSFSETPSSKDGRDQSRIVTVVEQIHGRLVDVEAIVPPSIPRPWVVEAVLLPPPPLRGVWTSTAPGFVGYESSNPQSVSTFSGTQRRKSSDSYDGPLPRSFGVNSRVYYRLLSRGFVKNLLITGPTAYDVATAIEESFGPLLEWCQSFYGGNASSPGSSASQRPPGRKCSSWQPLRKLHKQRNLSFLKSGEMMEGLWSVEFLKGSCIMKSSKRQVLYITPLLRVHPPPYEGVSWADIKSLPRAKPTVLEMEVGRDSNAPEQLQPPEVDLEGCWAWRDALDEKIRAPTVSVSPEPDISPASWSSFGPFQHEDGTRHGNTRNPSPTAAGTTPPDTAPAARPSPGPISPPMSTSHAVRKRKPSSPLQDAHSHNRGSSSRVQRRARRAGERHSPVEAAGTEGLTPAMTVTTRSGSYPPSSMPTSMGGRQGSGLSVFSGLEAGEWELSPGTMGWFMENPSVLEEGEGEGESGVNLGRSTVEEVVEEEEGTQKEGEGVGGYGSFAA